MLWDWRNNRAVEQGLSISSWSLKITSSDVILSRTTAAHSARSGKPFMSGDRSLIGSWRGRGKEERTRICRSAFVQKNSPLRVEEIALGFLRVYMSIISDAFHVCFTLLLNLWTPPLSRLNLKLLVSLKNLALEWTCKASWKTLVNCYKLSVFAFPREHQSKVAHYLLRGWVVWVILNWIYILQTDFKGEKFLQGNTWPKKFWKIKQPLGTGPGGF